jgi:hypothetical protein
MVTSQSVVLWSRLHLLMGDAKTIKWTKYKIIIDAIMLHVPTTVLTFGSNGDIGTATFVRGFNIYEKVQVVGSGKCLTPQSILRINQFIVNSAFG